MRAIQAVGTDVVVEPDWMVPFLASLARDDLSPATLRGYRYDLRHFLAWHRTVQDAGFAIGDLADFELIAYRQHMVAAGRRDCRKIGGARANWVFWRLFSDRGWMRGLDFEVGEYRD